MILLFFFQVATRCSSCGAFKCLLHLVTTCERCHRNDRQPLAPGVVEQENRPPPEAEAEAQVVARPPVQGDVLQELVVDVNTQPQQQPYLVYHPPQQQFVVLRQPPPQQQVLVQRQPPPQQQFLVQRQPSPQQQFLVQHQPSPLQQVVVHQQLGSNSQQQQLVRFTLPAPSGFSSSTSSPVTDNALITSPETASSPQSSLSSLGCTPLPESPLSDHSSRARPTSARELVLSSGPILQVSGPRPTASSSPLIRLPAGLRLRLPTAQPSRPRIAAPPASPTPGCSHWKS